MVIVGVIFVVHFKYELFLYLLIAGVLIWGLGTIVTLLKFLTFYML